MNEFHNAKTAGRIRRPLLATASALALVGYAALPQSAQAGDNDRPTVWIEGGWHFESFVGKDDPLVPPLDAVTRVAGFTSLTTLEDALGRTYGAEGGISFQPKVSDWVFAVSGRYGRVQTTRRALDDKTIVAQGPLKDTFLGTLTPTFHAYAIGFSKKSESHAILDFQVGKDIGVGLLGGGTDSIISFGARYAQMSSKSKAHSYAAPDATFEQITSNPFGVSKYHIRIYAPRSAAFADRSDSLHAIGPSLSLENTTGLLGSADGGQLALDWGVNAAVLFGRQKTKVSHHSTIGYVANQPMTRSRSRMVTIPNIGGFAGLSYRFPHAKLSAGYRADFFFRAKDGGLDTANTTDVGFHGPYATVSIGLGG